MKRDSSAIRVILVDDHPALRHGLIALLGAMGIEVVGVAASAAETLACLAQTSADAAVVDLTLEDGSGFDVLAALGRDAPAVKPVVYSVHEDSERVRRALGLGARGYVTKREDPALLAECLRRVHVGEQYLSPRVARKTAGAHEPAPAPPPEEALSPQEMQVYALAGRGHSAQEIAGRMDLSIRTIDTYYERIIRKLNLAGRRELIRHASAWVRLNDGA